MLSRVYDLNVLYWSKYGENSDAFTLKPLTREQRKQIIKQKFSSKQEEEEARRTQSQVTELDAAAGFDYATLIANVGAFKISTKTK